MQLTRENITKKVKDMQATRAPIQKRWDFYRNDVARLPYFPHLHKETPEHYRDRIKVAINWCGSLEDRIAAYFRKPPIKITFSVDDKETNRIAKEAADTWAAIAEYNDYDTFMIDVARAAGVGGNGHTKERFIQYDHESGLELKTGKYKGRIKINRVSEAFIYRMNIGGVNAFVEAWVRMNGQTKFLHQEYEGVEDKFEYIELILPPYWDSIKGNKKNASSWAIWEKKIRTYGHIEIPYTYIPIQRFANLVSRPESENGISDIAKLIPINDYVNHVISGTVRAIEYHGEPKIAFFGVEEDADIKWGTDQALYLSGPEGANVDARFLEWSQNIDGARTVYRDGADIMSALSGVPKHMMHDLDGAGRVPSGVALRIIYESMNQLCTLKEAGFKAAEERMIATCLDMLAFHNGQPGKFKDVKITIQYNPDRTPRDIDAEFEQDMKKKLIGFLNLVDLVLKYESGIETREQALKFLEAKAEEKKKLQEMGLIAKPIEFNWNDDDDKSGSDKKVQKSDSDTRGDGTKAD